MAELTLSLLERCQQNLEWISGSLNLTVSEFKTLRAFRSGTDVASSELASRVGVSTSRLTRILDGLVAKGIVRRKHTDADRRVLSIVLTERGKGILARLIGFHVRTQEEILAELPEGAGDNVIAALEKLRDAMEDWVNDSQSAGRRKRLK